MKKVIQIAQKSDRIIVYSIYAIIILWLSLLMITTLFPGITGEATFEGKKAEAITLKDYGDHFLTAGDYKMAAGQYLKAVQLSPDNNAAWSNLAICYSNLGLYEKAITCLKNALNNKVTRKYIIYYNLGDLYFKKHEYLSSIKWFEKAVETHPFPMEIYVYLGRVYKEQKDWGKAMDAYTTSLALIPDVSTYYTGTLKEYTFEFTGNKKDSLNIIRLLESFYNDEKILSCFDLTAFDFKNENKKLLSDIYNDIGFIYANVGDQKKAIETISLALEYDPASSIAMNNLKILKKGQ